MTLLGQYRILKPKKKKILQNKLTERILKEIKSNLHQTNYLPKEILPHLSGWIEIQLKHGLSPEKIAEELNNIKMPTLSGRGVWKSDTIEYLLSYLI